MLILGERNKAKTIEASDMDEAISYCVTEYEENGYKVYPLDKENFPKDLEPYNKEFKRPNFTLIAHKNNVPEHWVAIRIFDKKIPKDAKIVERLKKIVNTPGHEFDLDLRVRKDLSKPWFERLSAIAGPGVIIGIISLLIYQREFFLELLWYRPVVYAIYTGEYITSTATLSANQSTMYSFEGSRMRETKKVSTAGDSCVWTLHYKTRVGAIGGSACSVDADTVRSTAQKLVGSASSKPFHVQLAVAATWNDNSPLINPKGVPVPMLDIKILPSPLSTPIAANRQNPPLTSSASHKVGGHPLPSMIIAHANRIPRPTDVHPLQTALAAAQQLTGMTTSSGATVGTRVETMVSFNKLLQAHPGISQKQGPFQLVQDKKPIFGLLGPGVANCTLDAHVVNGAGTVVVFRQDFVGDAASANPISDAFLTHEACQNAVKKVVKQLENNEGTP